jgi:hypothetical protein
MRTALSHDKEISFYAINKPVGFTYAPAPPIGHFPAQLFRLSYAFIAITGNILQQLVYAT